MKVLRIVHVGCGSMSGVWLKVATSLVGVEIVGLVDLDEGNAHKRAEEYGLTDVYVGKDLNLALKTLKPDIVFDCTVPPAHVDVTLAALLHGCHVLGEKPMADSMANARRMVAAAKQAGKIYAVMQNRRYNPHILTAKRFLESGKIGKLHTVNADFYLAPHFGGFREQMDHVLLLDMAIHTFDQARFITGADPVAAYCYEYNPAGSWYKHGACAQVIFEMGNGLVFNYRGSWCADGFPTSWESNWRVVGEIGTLKWDGGAGLKAAIGKDAKDFIKPDESVPIEPVILDEAMHGHGGIIQDFIYCLMEGGLPQTICTDNIKSLAMVFAAIESAAKGQRVKIII